MKTTAFNRLALLISYMCFVGFLAYIKAPDLVQISTNVGAAIGVYVAVKGKGEGPKQ
jgi:hypothetical protein